MVGWVGESVSPRELVVTVEIYHMALSFLAGSRCREAGKIVSCRVPGTGHVPLSSRRPDHGILKGAIMQHKRSHEGGAE